MPDDLDPRIHELATSIWEARPRPWRRPVVELSRRLLGRLDERPATRSALFRFVDVAPACRGPVDRGAHLSALIREARPEGVPTVLRPVAARRAPTAVLGAYGLLSGPATALVARQFIAGRTVAEARRALRSMWRRGHGFAVDLLGEATVTEDEATSYAARCERALVELDAVTSSWADHPLLDRDPHGALPRANLSIKLSALTPLVRPLSPERGATDAVRRLRPLLETARRIRGHVHLDMEDFDGLETVLVALEDALSRDEFRGGPSVGLVVQAYLRESESVLERILASPPLTERAVPLTIRLVKGAYWEHEHALAAQHGWEPPVWGRKEESDRAFERLSRRLIDERERIRPAIATHNLRSVAQALAYLEAQGGSRSDLEVQVLRGLGDELAAALAAVGCRVRVYTPTGDLVAGMAYLVRRLLENSSSQGFLVQQRHHSIDDLLEAPA